MLIIEHLECPKKSKKEGGKKSAINLRPGGHSVSISLLSFIDVLFKIKLRHRLKLEISCTQSIVEEWNPLICEAHLRVHISSQNKGFPEGLPMFSRPCWDGDPGCYFSYLPL